MESKEQKKLIDQYEKEGWYVIKLMKTNRNGIPDLLCLHQDFCPRFIEVKDVGGVVSELQKYRIEEIEKKTGIKTIIHYPKQFAQLTIIN